MKRVGIFGAGYVGLVTGACLAELGHRVAVCDVAAGRIGALRAGRVPIHEPDLPLLLERNAARLSFTTSARELTESCDVLVVCVDTPPTESGDADLSRVWAVVDELGGAAPGTVLVMKSTVPVGTADRIRAALDARGLAGIGYAANPEFTAEGSAVADFLRPDRIVVGAFEPADGEVVESLYDGIDATVVRTDPSSAEMVKLASNALLATRVSFINEIANVCELVGADVVEVAEAVGLDHRLGPHFLAAGLGYGGSCFPKDARALKQLARNSGYHFQLLSAVIEVNELQKRRVVQKLERHLGSLRGKTIALLGLAFKPGTDDVRESPSVLLAHRLLAEGAAVRAWDPLAAAGGRLPPLERFASPLEALAGADGAVLVTAWPELAELDWDAVAASMASPVLVDGRNFLDPAEAEAAGLVYEGIGRPAPGARREAEILPAA
ncbi:MAG TPA: UDP-glucose/GDP-mannose dehydrogenase family protein [Gaiellaceae bacterium]|nr:UDP-glucose/GDP-mannose dehydrogenase family protein [Gaiellaceae bacterium]